MGILPKGGVEGGASAWKLQLPLAFKCPVQCIYESLLTFYYGQAALRLVPSFIHRSLPKQLLSIEKVNLVKEQFLGSLTDVSGCLIF
jgi:hypothetical protein